MNLKPKWLMIFSLILGLAYLALKQAGFWQPSQHVGAARQDPCLYAFCDGEKVPKVGPDSDLMKVNGVYLVAPKDLFRGMRSAVFPIPGLAHEPNQPAAEAELFLRQDDGQPLPYQKEFLSRAESNGWIASRREIRPGLELWIMKHLMYRDYLIDQVQYYVLMPNPTLGPSPPSSICLKDNDSSGGGGAVYPWKYGIKVYIRWPKGYCDRWPEIYAEAKRRMDLLQKFE